MTTPFARLTLITILPCHVSTLASQVLTLEERVANHKRGHKPAFFAHYYGVRLLPDLFRHLNPMSYEYAKAKKVELACI